MNQSDVLGLIEETGAIITDSHIVYTSRKHGGVYVNKDALYPYPNIVRDLCDEIAQRFCLDPVDAVVAPAVGGTLLSTWTAHRLGELKSIIANRLVPVLSLYAEKETVAIPDSEGQGRSCFAETGRFVLKRGYDKLVEGQSVLVVEDVLTTGGSVRKVVEAVRRHDGHVVGVMALCNRGGVTAQDVGNVPRLDALVNLTLESYNAAHCPLCAHGIPINTTVGKGAEFIARQSRCPSTSRSPR